MTLSDLNRHMWASIPQKSTSQLFSKKKTLNSGYERESDISRFFM